MKFSMTIMQTAIVAFIVDIEHGDCVAIHKETAEEVSILSWRQLPSENTTALSVAIGVLYATNADHAKGHLCVTISSLVSPSYRATQNVDLETSSAEIVVNFILDAARTQSDTFTIYTCVTYSSKTNETLHMFSARVDDVVFTPLQHVERRQAAGALHPEAHGDCNDTDDACGVYELAGHCSPNHTL